MMKDASCAIERILEMRFGKMEAQALRFGRARVVRKDVQFMDVKMMSELMERYRARTRAAILEYRLWHDAHEVQTDSIERLYGAAEGAALHRRVSDAFKLWYFAHRDCYAMRRAYLRKCLSPQVRVDWDEAA